METLAVFTEEDITREAVEEAVIGDRKWLHIRCPATAKGLRRRWLLRRLVHLCDGCSTTDAKWSALLGLPHITADGCRLATENAAAILRIFPAVERLVVVAGCRHDILLAAELAAAVRFAELVTPPDLASYAEEILLDTLGAAVPVTSSMPTVHGAAVLSCPDTAAPMLEKPALWLNFSGGEGGLRPMDFRFLPPAPLKKLCVHTGNDAGTLEALIGFFALPMRIGSVYLSNFTK